MNANLLVFLQMGDGMGSAGWGFGYRFVGLAVMVLFFLAVVYLLARVFSGDSDGRSEIAPSRSTSEDDQALAELRERYARGEIDDEEFEERKRRLRGDSTSLE